MSELRVKQHYRILLQILLNLSVLLLLGLILITIFKWGEILPFISSLFKPDDLSVLTVTLIGLLAGAMIVTVIVTLIVLTKTELPKSEAGEIVNRLMRTPSGIAASSLGGGFFEEFFFRGTLIGLFIGYSTALDWVVIFASTILFWIIHVPQYKGIYLAHAGVIVNGLIFALLFYYTGSLIPAILAHAIYNLGIGIYFMNK